MRWVWAERVVARCTSETGSSTESTVVVCVPVVIAVETPVVEVPPVPVLPGAVVSVVTPPLPLEVHR